MSLTQGIPFLPHIILYRLFEWLIVTIIFLNSIALALFDYADRDSLSLNNKMIDRVNIVFTVVFIAEALMKIIAYGLFLHKNAYLRSGWNIIDATVVLSGYD